MFSESPVGESLALTDGDNSDRQELGERCAQSKHPARGIKLLAEPVRHQHQQIKLGRHNDYGDDEAFGDPADIANLDGSERERILKDPAIAQVAKAATAAEDEKAKTRDC